MQVCNAVALLLSYMLMCGQGTNVRACLALEMHLSHMAQLTQLANAVKSRPALVKACDFSVVSGPRHICT